MQPTCATRRSGPPAWLTVPATLLLAVWGLALGCEASPATQLDPPAQLEVTGQTDIQTAPVAPDPGSGDGDGDASTAAPPAPAPASAPAAAPPATGTATAMDLPSRFQAPDPYANIAEACLDLAPKLAGHLGAMRERAVYDFCEHRSYHSSRHKVIVSRVDGSQIHDRDRPWGWRFYAAGIINGTLTPNTCEHHKLDDAPHPKACKDLARNWPFKRPKLTEELRYQWFAHLHDAERFGTRGPHDNHLSTAVAYIPGCYPPDLLDRFDFAAEVTILRSVDICETHGCRSKWDIREKWRVGGAKQKATREAARGSR